MHVLANNQINIVDIDPKAIPNAICGARQRSHSTCPETVFAVAENRHDEYVRLCRQGYARMGRQRVVIAGLCRNIAPILPATILRIDRLAALFRQTRIVIYENDSEDETKKILHRWAGSDPRVTAITENNGHPVNLKRRCLARATRMAAYRKRCQQAVVDCYRHFDAVILLDMDLIGGWSEDGIANTFGHDNWDGVGANGLIFRRKGFRVNSIQQYDTWAYRCEATPQPLPTARVAHFVPQCGEPLIRVTSCFGGMGIYTMKAFAAGNYDGNDCEHIAFHRSLAKQGFSRIYMNPSQIVIYGRKHRSTDHVMSALLCAWAKLRRIPAATWLFTEDHHSTASENGGRDFAASAIDNMLIQESQFRRAA